MSWLTPQNHAPGSRTLAFWDEDSVTMAVAAARSCLAGAGNEARASVTALHFATTTPPFAEPLNASIIHGALRLEPQVLAQDCGGTTRGGLAALQAALEAGRPALVVAADMPVAPAGSLAETRSGDGAAAVMVGGDSTLLAYRGGASLTAPFFERYRAADRPFGTDWEERWVREEGYLALVPQAVSAALAKAGLAAADIRHFVMPCPIPGVARAVAQACGLGSAQIASALEQACGDTGTAHGLIMLAHALPDLVPGDRIVVSQFGQGATALVLEATAAISGFDSGIAGALRSGIEETNYLKLPVFRGLVPWERGLRGRFPVNEALTTGYRNAEALLGFVGGRSPETGQVQFPASRLAVAEAGFHPEAQEPWPIADLGGIVATSTADRLAFSRHPPNCYGLVDIAGGGRLMMDFTDADAASIAPGDPVRFVFRIKDIDERTGYRRYFWKAAALPAAGEEG